MRLPTPLLTALFVVALAVPAMAISGLPVEGDSVEKILVALVVILLAAKLGGGAVSLIRQPAVLGELIAGVVLGNMTLIGIGWFEPIQSSRTIEILAEIGVLILLFEVGLESHVGEMLKVGVSSFFVATLGVIAPFFLGWGVAAWFYPEHSIYMHAFIGATLTATSVGITARVLKDIKQIQSSESRIILGAAVIDDVLGLIVLAIVTGVVSAANGGQEVSSLSILWIIGKAILFLGGAVLLSRLLYPTIFRIANYLQVHGMLLIMALSTCFFLSALAAAAGLAPIVGAFAAGLVLDSVYYRDLSKMSQYPLDQLIEPIAIFLVPVFFIHMGMMVDLRTFGQTSVLGFAAVLTVAAILSKQVSSFGVLMKGANRWIVGLGMIPRGEVGLIFAAIGMRIFLGDERMVPDEVYSAVIIMVIITVMITPPLLTWAFRRKSPSG